MQLTTQIKKLKMWSANMYLMLCLSIYGERRILWYGTLVKKQWAEERTNMPVHWLIT